MLSSSRRIESMIIEPVDCCLRIFRLREDSWEAQVSGSSTAQLGRWIGVLDLRAFSWVWSVRDRFFAGGLTRLFSADDWNLLVGELSQIKKRFLDPPEFDRERERCSIWSCPTARPNWAIVLRSWLSKGFRIPKKYELRARFGEANLCGKFSCPLEACFKWLS